MSLQLGQLRLGGQAADSTALPAGLSRRALVVRLAVLLFFALLVEGIARKWVFPGYHQYFYFLRDPLVLALYLLAGRWGVLRWTRWLILWFAAAYLLSLTSLLVYALKGGSPFVWALGVRNYFMYIPLAFIVARTFERTDIGRFARLVAVSAIPLALVCVEQHLSPPGAWINVGAGGVIPPRLAGEIMRTTGLLASNAQHELYMAFMLAVLAAAFVGARYLRVGSFLLCLGGVAVLTMMVVSGERGVWFLAVAVGFGALAGSFLTRPGGTGRLRAAMVPAAAGFVVLVLFTALFARAYEAYQERNRVARTFSEATVERIVKGFVPYWMFEAPIEGEGIGVATTGAAAIMTGERALTLAETDWDRNFVELGIIGGWILVFLRIWFSIWLAWIGFRAARRGDPTALVLASFAAPAILAQQITMHTVYAHFAWFAAGLTMAAARCALTLTEMRPFEGGAR